MLPKKEKKKKKVKEVKNTKEEPVNDDEKVSKKETILGKTTILGGSVEESNSRDDSKPSLHERRSTAKSLGSQEGALSSVKSEETLDTVSEMSVTEDIVTLTVPETSQKIAHCLVGQDLFVDKTWCMVKKADILEDVAVQDRNSPFFALTQKITSYPGKEMLIGYEPFSSAPNQFMLCITEAGRDEVLERLENLKQTYVRRIEQSKEIEPRKWDSQGSEEFVDQFQLKSTRKLISLEWIGDLTKRNFTEANFEDCDPDSMKNGYTCLVPSDKEKFQLVFKKTQETGIQAVAQQTEVSVQTEPEIPTNASTQYAPETEISLPSTDNVQAAITSQDLNAFFKKYLDYLLESLQYNEVYDLYHDDYPALFVSAEETQVQSFGTYHQYQSFTDVAAVEGKLVISSSWHPNYTGIVAVAYANEIPALMKELEFDSDQTDYEEEKTDDEGEGGEEIELGIGAKEWLEEERKERESTEENTEIFDKAMKKLKDIEAAKMIWDAKVQEQTEEIRKPIEETESDRAQDLYEYREYKEPEPEVAEGEGTSMTEGSEVQGAGQEHEEAPEKPATEETVSPKTSRMSFREQLEAEVIERLSEDVTVNLPMSDEQNVLDYSLSSMPQEGSGVHVPHRDRALSSFLRSQSSTSRKNVHHRKKHRKSVPGHHRLSLEEEGESLTSTIPSTTGTSSRSISMVVKQETIAYEPEYFEEISDEEEIKEKQDELPLLELNNPVLIWSFVDDLTPKLRLDSPYEIRVVSFSKHDGNLIAGGTASGQVVVWDITGRIEELEKPEPLTPDQQMFRKRMEKLMRWRRDIRSKRRVRISTISNQMESHFERVTSLLWVSPTAVVTDTVDIMRNPSSKANLQIVTTSLQGDLKVWDLNSEPLKVDQRKQAQLFKTKNRFGRPPSLDLRLDPFRKLHRRWKPLIQLTMMFENKPILLTGMQGHPIPVKYERVTPRLHSHREVLEDRVEYRAVFQDFTKGPTQLYISNLFGRAGTMSWEPMETKLPDGEIVPHTVKFWDLYHDGPITQVCRHPFIPTVCLTVGGHVFSIWHVENAEEPIFTKRYYGKHVTDGAWSALRPSLIRIARSDGVLEIWDLIIQSHAPATTIEVSGNVITNISPPLLPEARGLLGVADYNSAFRLFFIPQQFRVWTEKELDRLKKFINREPERKKKMKEWSKWWRENNVNLDREAKKQAEEQKKLDEELTMEKEKQEQARKKYNEEVYKWYMRRRGKPFLWREEAEERWRAKQEEHMHEMIMAKKKIDRNEMDLLMRPIVRDEKNEAQKHAKAQERLKQADLIFRQAVELIFPKSGQTQPKIVEEDEQFKEECYKLLEYYYGENFNRLADEQDEILKRSPWQLDFEWYEFLEKYNALRMLFNDRRRKRSKTLRWLRKKLREELMKEGRRVHIRKSHAERYQKRKIKRRQDNLDWLKNTYGENYNVYWDKHHPCRRFADKKFRYPIEDSDSHLLGELSEPDVEVEEWPELPTEGKVQSNLELITGVGIEHIAEDVFTADLDAALITMESRTSLGVKTIPSFKFQIPSQESSTLDKTLSQGTHLSPSRGYESPQDDSDISVSGDGGYDTSNIVVVNQMQELDYIQQSTGAAITMQTKQVASLHKREISEGIQIKTSQTSEDVGVEQEILDTTIDYSEISEDHQQGQSEYEDQMEVSTESKDENDTEPVDEDGKVDLGENN